MTSLSNGAILSKQLVSPLYKEKYFTDMFSLGEEFMKMP